MSAADPILQREPRPGVSQWRNPRNGLVVVQLHYTVDPAKRTAEWKAGASRNMSPRDWKREYEIDWTTPEGDPVVPEFSSRTHVAEFTWDTSLRPLRFWDFGFVSPVCLLAQRTWWGQLRVRREVCPFNTPLDQLLPMVRAIGLELGGRDAMLAESGESLDIGGGVGAEPGSPVFTRRDPRGTFDAGDPAATNQTDLGASADYLAGQGIHLHTTRPGTEVSYAGLRGLFLRSVLEPGVGVWPAILLHPDCRLLAKALGGAFYLSPLPPYKPVKAHPHKDLVDALRYGVDNLAGLGTGALAAQQRAAALDIVETRAGAPTPMEPERYFG